MAYNGYLLKVGGKQIPNKFIQLSTYSITPNQRMESSAERDTTGMLHRETCEHTATKIEFNTPYIRGVEVAELNSLLGIAGDHQRNVTVDYFEPETQSYKNADCYMPDVQYSIYSEVNNDLLYSPIRYAFIEY